jgi:FSR family fosmidomycin resistance protein-like MFS transporter
MANRKNFLREHRRPLNLKITKFQWRQLSVLTGVHFLLDMSCGVLPAALPVVRDSFSLSLTQGVSLLTVLYFSCNLFQVFLGHLRARQRRPLFLPLGTALAAAIYLTSIVPNFRFSFTVLVLLAVITGFGVAVAHLESLRSLHWLRRIPSAIGTAVFLNAGFLGFTGGGLIGASLVQWLGLNGLLLAFVPFAAGLLFLLRGRLRLAIERVRIFHTDQVGERVHFWLLFAVATPLAICSTVVPALIPTALNELGYPLYFGGLPALMLGLGGIAGSFFWASVSSRLGRLAACSLSAIAAGPFLFAYMLLMNQPTAILLLAAAGFGAQGSYILVVSMARHSPALVLGQRMGLIMGGVWGLAALVLMALGPVAEHFGVRTVLDFAPLGYVLAGITGLAALGVERLTK